MGRRYPTSVAAETVGRHPGATGAVGSPGPSATRNGAMSCRRLARLSAAILALVLVAGACSSDPPTVVVSGDDPTTAAKDLAATLEAEGFTILAALVEEAGITDLFVDGEGDETYTVFAPTDAAFGELAPGLADLLAGEDDVVADPARPTEGSEVNTGQETGIEGEAEDATAAEAGATDEGDESSAEAEGTDGEADAAADPDASAAPDENATADAGSTEGESAADEGATDSTDDESADDESTGDAATTDEGDDEAAAPTASTPLAERPSREEIRTLLADILSYHVVEGTVLSEDLLAMDSVTSLEGSDLEVGTREEPPATEDGEPTEVPTIQGADISGVDLRATNGVVHTIDSLLIPEDRADAIATLVASIPVTTDPIATLESTGEHAELLAALRATGLDEALTDAPELTLFAPTDAAFGQLSEEQRTLLTENPDVLTAVLSYHAVGRTITTADVQNQESVASLEGQTLEIIRTLIRPETEDEESTDEESTDEDAAEEEEPTEPAEPPAAPEEQYTVQGVVVEDSILTTNGVIHVIGEVLVPESAMGPGGL